MPNQEINTVNRKESYKWQHILEVDIIKQKRQNITEK